MSDPQDIAEAVDDDKLADHDGGEEAGADFPPDRPSGVDRMAMTPAEEAFPEPLRQRAAREVPDPLAVELDRRAEELASQAPGHLGTPLDDELATEDERLARDPELGDAVLGSDGDVDRLVATSPLVGDDEATLIAEEVGSLADESAEEAAVHPAGGPPLRAGDSYLDDDA